MSASPGIVCVGTATTIPSRFHTTTVSGRAWEDNPLEDGPARNVDYLSHKWEEEGIWTSWRYVVASNDFRDKVRLENSSWTTWAKKKYRLRTVSLETIDWAKDSDVTWLYGPLQKCSRGPWASDSSAPCDLSTSNFALDKKSVPKRKSTSKASSGRSLLVHTLLKNAAAIVQAQKYNNRQSRTLERPMSESTPPGTLRRRSSTPTNTHTATSIPQCPHDRRRVHFNNEVQHCYEQKCSEDGKDDKHRFLDNESSGNWSVMKIRKGDNEQSVCAAQYPWRLLFTVVIMMWLCRYT